MHGNPHELFLRDIRPECVILLCTLIHHMQSGIDRIQRGMEICHHASCFHTAGMTDKMIDIFIILQHILMILIHIDKTVQCKDQSVDCRNVLDGGNRSFCIQFIQIFLTFGTADSNSQIHLRRIITEYCCPSDTCFFCDLSN